ncbi:DUF1501 domain-containing protein [Algisphaera agarilytica]|uniref:Uncharacterized protein (DUF1501 family) n=1 Tax=Algisphaera agarilytica TaxID=1385975 RepID=A0A7X0H8N1_9BACT|nr:DUF1501 domain-containing protein [Algisphaera agarilytica]MBB6429834.1 uncharacterized protein (DUF1501 family) [Algisphaera agarilytica]
MNDNLDQLISRRSLLRRGSCAALGLAGLGSQLLTTRSLAAALDQESFDDYRALVCVFLFGGNDNGNTLIPLSGGDQSYRDYAKARGNLAIPSRYLKPMAIKPDNAGGQTFALHPALKGFQQRFKEGNAAVVANVGTLLQPTTLRDYRRGAAHVPQELFAHERQAEQWQLSRPDARDGLGWGGRLADMLQAAATNQKSSVSMNISVAGVSQFLSGQTVNPYVLGPDGTASFSEDEMSRRGKAQLRRAYMDMLAASEDPGHANRHAMQDVVRDVTERAIVNGEMIEGMMNSRSRIKAKVPEENPLATQLHTVARLIENAESKLGHRRQVFFVSIGGFDHHDGLVGDEDYTEYMGPHGELLTQVDQALTHFWEALGQLGKRDEVTTFTASDFGRTFASNGSGSDHGWGGHHLVMGGKQLQGNRLYGTFPNIRINGPDDVGDGRFIPTTSVDAYGFEFARWMGVPLSEMSTVFPNVGRFLDVGNPSSHLGLLA